MAAALQALYYADIQKAISKSHQRATPAAYLVQLPHITVSPKTGYQCLENRLTHSLHYFEFN